MAYTAQDYQCDISMFSDMHKDAYGCRPHAVPTPSMEDMPRVIEEMQRRIELEIKYERLSFREEAH